MAKLRLLYPSLLLFWCLLAMVNIIEADNFPVCSKCNCALLPTTLDGRVVDVPAPTTGGNDWLVFNESIRSNATAVFLFRSINPACKVEIKLKSINSTVQFLVYPGGRIDPTTATTDLAPAPWVCGYFRAASTSVFLGTSMISTTQELAVAFINPGSRVSQVAVDLQLYYRQHCAGTMDQGGFALPSPAENGAMQKVRLGGANGAAQVPWTSSNIVTWSIRPPSPNCAMELTFTENTNNILVSLNDLDNALMRITFRVPRGMEATIRLQNEAAVTVEYRTADCGSSFEQSRAIQIASWNDVVKPLKRVSVPAGHDPWQIVNFTFPYFGMGQISVSYLIGPTEPAYVPLSSWTESRNWEGLPEIYKNDFHTRFKASVLAGTKPFVFVSDYWISTTSLRYAFLPIAAPPLLVAETNNLTFNELPITPEMITARRVYIQAANKSCAIELAEKYGYGHPLHALPFGFNAPNLNDILDNFYQDSRGEDDARWVGIGIVARTARSIGPIMGIQFFAWSDLVEEPESFLYRMVCPTPLDTAISLEKWRYVSFPTGTSYILPPPPAPKDGKQCWVDVSGLSSDISRDGTVVLLVSCLQTPMGAALIRGRETILGNDFNCTDYLRVDAFGRWRDSRPLIPRNSTLFAYRVRCSNASTHDLAPLVPLNTKFVATSNWKTLDTEEYEYETAVGGELRHIWMLQTESPNCRVEFHVDKTADLADIGISEDYMKDLGPLVHTESGVRISNLRYVSCGPRVFITWLSKEDKFRYRQVCGNDRRADQCFQNVTLIQPSLHNSDWQTFGVASSTGNLNQLRQLRYHIPFPGAVGGNISLDASSKVLELEFTSLVTAESWIGVGQLFHSAETHGVWVNDKYRAIVGKQYLFKESVEIRLDPLLRTQRGDHLFTVRYRMVDAKQAREEIRLGEMLMATSKPRTLNFKIPQQFSTERLRQMRKKKRFDFEYETDYGTQVSGDFPVWFFRHHYTIRPANTKCQVALKFTKMDIGSGYLMGESQQYSNGQHRLSVTLNSNVTQRLSLTCASILDNLEKPRRSIPTNTTSLCARMDHTYVSAPGFALALLFRSADGGEYEYEKSESENYVQGFAANGLAGSEVTFGSGWTATYQQLCASGKADALQTIPLTPVTAKLAHHPQDWQQNLPRQLASDKYRLFRDRRWTITPQQSGCEVQYQVQYVKQSKTEPREPIPILFQIGSNLTLPGNHQIFTSANVTVVQLGTSKANPIMINYRQICPTASPTTPSPTVVAHSKVDGETCSYDGECASGICSKILQRCTAKTCATQCVSKDVNQAMCQAFSVVGCSCQWSSQTSSCVMVA